MKYPDPGSFQQPAAGLYDVNDPSLISATRFEIGTRGSCEVDHAAVMQLSL